MRTVMMTLVVASLLATPSLGIINVKLIADGPVVDGKVQLAYGATTTIRVMAQGTSSGILSLAGDVVANTADPILLTSNPGSGGFPPAFSPPPILQKPGSPGPNGGWINWGTGQTYWDVPDPNLGRLNYVEVFHYTITGTAPGPGDVHLSITLKTVGGYKPLEVDKTAVLGELTGVTIHVPEPMTLTLLTMAGLVAVRRRRA